MRTVLILSFLASTACDKGSDSAGSQEAAESDADTDTDTAIDTGFVGTVQLEVTDDATGDVLCDTTIALTGTAYSGLCPDCDFTFGVFGTVTAEAGTDCKYDK